MTLNIPGGMDRSWVREAPSTSGTRGRTRLQTPPRGWPSHWSDRGTVNPPRHSTLYIPFLHTYTFTSPHHAGLCRYIVGVQESFKHAAARQRSSTAPIIIMFFLSTFNIYHDGRERDVMHVRKIVTKVVEDAFWVMEGIGIMGINLNKATECNNENFFCKREGRGGGIQNGLMKGTHRKTSFQWLRIVPAEECDA